MAKPKVIPKKKVETKAPVEKPKEKVASVSTAKQELIAYMEELKRKDVHEFAVREVELYNQLNKL